MKPSSFGAWAQQILGDFEWCLLLPQHRVDRVDPDGAKEGNPESDEGAEQEGQNRRGTERQPICRTE